MKRGASGASSGVLGALGRQLHLVPADLRLAGPPRRRARSRGEYLGAQANAHQRHPASQQLAEQVLFEAKPRVLLLLVGVHGPAEAEHGVIGVRFGRGADALGDLPAVELVAAFRKCLGKYPGPGVGLMDDRKGSHKPSLSEGAATCPTRYVEASGKNG